MLEPCVCHTQLTTDWRFYAEPLGQECQRPEQQSRMARQSIDKRTSMTVENGPLVGSLCSSVSCSTATLASAESHSSLICGSRESYEAKVQSHHAPRSSGAGGDCSAATKSAAGEQHCEAPEQLAPNAAVAAAAKQIDQGRALVERWMQTPARPHFVPRELDTREHHPFKRHDEVPKHVRRWCNETAATAATAASEAIKQISAGMVGTYSAEGHPVVTPKHDAYDLGAGMLPAGDEWSGARQRARQQSLAEYQVHAHAQYLRELCNSDLFSPLERFGLLLAHF